METHVLGESPYLDKCTSSYAGCVCKDKESEKWQVRQYAPYYDEDNDITVDNDFVIDNKSFDTDDAAIDFAKEYYKPLIILE